MGGFRYPTPPPQWVLSHSVCQSVEVSAAACARVCRTSCVQSSFTWVCLLCLSARPVACFWILGLGVLNPAGCSAWFLVPGVPPPLARAHLVCPCVSLPRSSHCMSHHSDGKSEQPVAVQCDRLALSFCRGSFSTRHPSTSGFFWSVRLLLGIVLVTVHRAPL